MNYMQRKMIEFAIFASALVAVCFLSVVLIGVIAAGLSL